ncbi:glycosyl transferase group 1 [Zychaea mexicana]|uniref:glycosyl transferase group 1 n=1 Tax=Zychaea mexicana TaxID=64656 RepID=UPI0022FE81B5|nr:glycosyl transferase group 1 [Zychaea mexicana]KAI9490655.1 glycosyl transferase group 1 [Zychaea mexicana]
MRIAIITENFLPKVDGVTRTLARLLEHLQDTGHQVLLLGPESGRTEYAGATLLGTAGIPFLPYPELKLNLWRPAFTQKLIDFEPDVIHLVDPVWLGAAGLAVCRYYLPNTPLVSSYHTNLATYCGHFGWGFFTPLMWRWNKFCHSYCHYVVCPSKSTSRMLANQGFDDNLRIWPRGVDMGMFSPSRRSKALRAQWMGVDEAEAHSKAVILYVGRVSFEKNLDLVIEAYKGMNHQRCHLVIVGHGPAFDAIQSECAQTNTPVTFTGYLQGIQLAAAYASADIFAFPSVTETFGQVVLEAMASGLPVAGLRAEGVRDLVDHGRTGTLLDIRRNMPRDQQISKYQQHLLTLVENPEMRLRMSRAALDKAKRYTWWEAMEAMVRVYRDAVIANNPYFAKEESLAADHTSSGDSGVEEDFPADSNCGAHSSILIASS